MAREDIGRVGFVAKGDYSASATYEKLDLVIFDNATYVCRKTVSGIEPVDGAVTEFWQPFSQAIDFATTSKAGIVKPDGTTITVDADGTIHGSNTLEMLSTKEEVSANTQAGKVADALVTKDIITDVAQLNQSIVGIEQSSKYQKGDSFTIYGQFVALTNTNGIYFSLPLSKPISLGVNLTVSAENNSISLYTNSGVEVVSVPNINVYNINEMIFCIISGSSRPSGIAVVYAKFTVSCN